MGKLTVKSVAALKEPGRYSDGDGSGFHVRVDAQLRKYWVLRVAGSDGKRKDVAIGSAQKMTLAVARERAREIRSRGSDEAGEAAAELTFSEAARRAHKARTAGYRNEKHVAQWVNTLQQHAFPVIGDKPVEKVTRSDVVELLEPIWLKTPETARRVLQRVDRVMRWAVGHGHRRERVDMDLVRDALTADRVGADRGVGFRLPQPHDVTGPLVVDALVEAGDTRVLAAQIKSEAPTCAPAGALLHPAATLPTYCTTAATR